MDEGRTWLRRSWLVLLRSSTSRRALCASSARWRDSSRASRVSALASSSSLCRAEEESACRGAEARRRGCTRNGRLCKHKSGRVQTFHPHVAGRGPPESLALAGSCGCSAGGGVLLGVFALVGGSALALELLGQVRAVEAEAVDVGAAYWRGGRNTEYEGTTN